MKWPCLIHFLISQEYGMPSLRCLVPTKSWNKILFTVKARRNLGPGLPFKEVLCNTHCVLPCWSLWLWGINPVIIYLCRWDSCLGSYCLVTHGYLLKEMLLYVVFCRHQWICSSLLSPQIRWMGKIPALIGDFPLGIFHLEYILNDMLQMSQIQKWNFYEANLLLSKASFTWSFTSLLKACSVLFFL